MYAQVIVDIVHENVAHTFTYAVPEGMALAPGWRVAVPFGRRRVEGIVIALAETCDLSPDKVKPVAETLEDYPAVLPAMLKLALDVAAGEPADDLPLADGKYIGLPYAELTMENIDQYDN